MSGRLPQRMFGVDDDEGCRYVDDKGIGWMLDAGLCCGSAVPSMDVSGG